MKKIATYIVLFSLGAATFTSCAKNTTKGIFGGPSVGGTVVKTVATVVGLILLSKLLKNVFKTVTGNSAFAGLTQDPQFKSTFNEDTRLDAIAKNDFTKAALQLLVSQHYKIPLQTVTQNYNGLTTAADLATFIGQNADAKILEGIK
ncbi:hypothetical protein [Ferruginibacter sp. HRS2-29]|uniref:hypothetical protein n=1 Tax=Ferruginibacter sp. HRS2-29 TaxID=2487334 RepID=UPI0020CB8845|nr:hypothetical protein [Ferruginibacter sp. HRS2-29]MCP9752728.1 hypothetical protein [Ferruginibacter sp. HRS2-29]